MFSKITTTCLATLMLFAASKSGHADLILTVTPASAGKTNWVFSTQGPTTASADNTFQGNNNGSPTKGGDARAWIAGDFTSINNTWTENAFAGVGVTIQGMSFTPDALYLDTRGSGDAIILSLGGADIDVNDGQTISWAGSAVLDIAISDLTVGAFTSNTFAGVQLNLNISAVPEPVSGLPICFAGALVALRRRRRS